MTVLTTIMAGLGMFMFNALIEHGNKLATHEIQIGVNTHRLDKIESSGTPGLMAHETADDARIAAHNARLEKLEAAVIVLQATPGELKSIATEIRGLRDGQGRIEKMLDDHMNKKP